MSDNPIIADISNFRVNAYAIRPVVSEPAVRHVIAFKILRA
jgi:hypothetical protein